MAISSNYYTNARITSLYSGMDTDTLITNSLYAEQNKLDKIFQKKERAEWQLEAYAEISNMVSDLRTNFLSVLGDNSVMKNATYNKYAASITENSAISVSANETALPTSLSILSAVKATAASVSAAAKNASRASVSGSNTLTVPNGITESNLSEIKLSDLKEAFGLAEDDTALTIGVNGKNVSFGLDTTLDQMKSSLAAQGVDFSFAGTVTNSTEGETTTTKADITFSFAMQDGSSLKLSNIKGKAFGEDGVFGVAEGTHDSEIMRTDTIAEALRKNGASEEDIQKFASEGITINGKNFKFDVNKDTLRSMMTTINSDDDAKATFSYSEITGKFSISSAETGADAALSFTGLAGFGLDAADVTAGSDAVVTLSDGTVMREASNEFTRDGITFNIKDNYNIDKETGAVADPDKLLRVDVEQDFSGTVDAVKKFVEDYNKIIEKLNTYYTEEDHSRKYPPLTDEQRDEMTEDEIKLWDEKARSGLLRNDSMLSSVLSNLRSAIIADNSETGMNIMDLGISTASWESGSWKTEQGKLVLDEEKLLAALKDDPQAVQKTLSNAVGEDGDEKAQGFFNKVDGYLRDFASNLRSKTSTLTSNVYTYETDYDEMMEKYYEKQEALYQKYAAMETALSELQAQTSELAGLLGGGAQ